MNAANSSFNAANSKKIFFIQKVLKNEGSAPVPIILAPGNMAAPPYARCSQRHGYVQAIILPK